MPNLRKIVIYVLAFVVVLWAANWLGKRAKPAYAKWRLTQALTKIEPWPATTNYSAHAWKQLTKAARVLQKTEPELAGSVLSEYLKKYAGQPAQLAVEHGKVFLLLRMVFDITDEHIESSASASQRSGSGLDAIQSAAWPIRWYDGQPVLVSGYPSTPLFRQPVADEYNALRYRYKYRDLSKVKF